MSRLNENRKNPDRKVRGRRLYPAVATGLILLSAWTTNGAELLHTSGSLANRTVTNTSRVVIVEDREAVKDFEPQPDRVAAMVDAGVVRLTGKPEAAAAWASLASPGDMVGIKVYALPGPVVGTRPSVVAAVVKGLLAAKVPAQNIVIWDRRLVDLRRAGYERLAESLGVRVAGAVDEGWDEKVFYESSLLGNLHWGDLEFKADDESVLGRKSFMSTLLTRRLTKLVVIAPLLNDNAAGVAGQLYSLALGSVDNITRFTDSPERLATAVPELCAQPQLAERVTLHISDALLAQYAGGTEARLHYTANLGQLRFSHDPVALDVLAMAELERQRASSRFPAGETNALLFHNAALLELGTDDLKRIAVETVR